MLAINSWDEDRETLIQFATKEKLKHRILLDGSETAEKYGLGRNIPVVLWIDRAGIVVDTEWGFGGAATLERKTKKLLAVGK